MNKPSMTFKQIAAQMTLESTNHEIFTEDQIKKIYYRALNKLRFNKKLQSYYK